MTISRAGPIASLLLGSILAAQAHAEFASGFPSPEEAAEVNERTVGVVLERDALVLDLMEDIESSLSLAAGLRIVPVIGRNHVQNVYDLLYLDGIDLALVRSDSIEYVRRVAGQAGARRLTRNVARIGNERIAVIAHEAYASLDELADRPVAFGRPGSGEFVTGTLLFESTGIDVTKVEAAGEDALGKVRSGELAAMVHLVAAPDAFPSSSAEASASGVRVLPLPRDERLSALYRRATLDARDLPGLIGPTEAVPTYSVDVNLVAYAWTSPNERTRRMNRFVEALVDRLDELQGDALQPEWEAVRLDADTPNIESSPMVERALAERAAALERWHERRVAAREAEAGMRTAYVERTLPGGGKVLRRLDEAAVPEAASRADRLFDELDALLANPADETVPPLRTSAEVVGRSGRRTLPSTGGPGSRGSDG